MRMAAGFTIGAGLAAAGAAQAQGYTVVPPADRLTLARILSHATPVVQVVFLLLILGVVATVAVWAMGLGRVSKGDAKGLAGALGRLKIMRSAAAPLGLLGASYTLLNGFIGLSNVRPTPTLAVLAPGWAEAALAVLLGLLATTVAVVCERHLEARIRRASA
jgi:biopolymer transport protein ExbB/TolQ